MATIEESLKALLADILPIELNQILPESRLRADLGADELDMDDISITLEDDLDIDIPVNDMNNIITFKNLVDYVESKL